MSDVLQAARVNLEAQVAERQREVDEIRTLLDAKTGDLEHLGRELASVVRALELEEDDQ